MYRVHVERTAQYYNSQLEEAMCKTVEGKYDDCLLTFEPLEAENISFIQLSGVVMELLRIEGVEPNNYYFNDDSVDFDDVIKKSESGDVAQEYAVTYRVSVEDMEGEILKEDDLRILLPVHKKRQ